MPGPARLSSLPFPAACLALAAFSVGLFPGCLENGKDSKSASGHALTGRLQKGPFISGSQVAVQPLDEHGKPDGEAILSETTNDSGDFRTVLKRPALADVSGAGRFFDEVGGAISDRDLTLKGVVMATGDGKVALHINVITHATRDRILFLIARGSGYEAAAVKAETELRKELGMSAVGDTSARAVVLNLLSPDENLSLYVLVAGSILTKAAALSSALGEDPTRKLQLLLDQAASDLEDDGSLEPALKSRLAAAEKALDPAAIQQNWARWLNATRSQVRAPDLSGALDTDKDGKPDSRDSDDDGDRVQDIADCAPRDALRQMLSLDGQRCVALYPPGPPMAIPGNGQVQLLWDTLPGAGPYAVLYGEGESPGSNPIRKDAASPGLVIGGLRNGARHAFAVAAEYAGVAAGMSPAVVATPMAVPGSLTASSGTSEITLAWAPVPGSSTYVLYHAPGLTVDKEGTRIPTAVSPCRITGLPNGAPRAFALASSDGARETVLGPVAVASPLAAPTGLVAAMGDRQIVLAWQPVAGAESYAVEYSPGQTLGPEALRLSGRTFPDTVRELRNGTRYAFQVRAHNATGASSWSQPVVSAALGPPKRLVARGATGRALLNWDMENAEETYTLRYWTGSTTAKEITGVYPPYELDGLKNGTLHYFTVSGRTLQMTTPPSNIDSCTPLARPDRVSVEPGSASVRVSWNPVPGALSYDLQYRPWQPGDTLWQEQISAISGKWMQGLTNDVPYGFRILAIGINSASDPGDAEGTIPMETVSGLEVQTLADTTLLEWKDAPSATGFRVYLAKGNDVDRYGIRYETRVPYLAFTRLEHGTRYSAKVEVLKSEPVGPLSPPISFIFRGSVETLGIPGFAGPGRYLSLALSESGSPYLAMVDESRGSSLRVFSYRDSAWTSLASPMSEPPTACCELKTGPGNALFLGYGEASSDSRIVVKRFEGDNWMLLGKSPASDARAEFLAMAVDTGGRPWVAYNDSSLGGKATVKRFHETVWKPVGNPGLTPGQVGPLALAISRSGIPCLASKGLARSPGEIRPSIHLFNGAWSTIADASIGLVNAEVGILSIGLSSNNVLYAAFGEVMLGGKASVISTTGSSWLYSGKPGFTSGPFREGAFAVQSQGYLYMAFADPAYEGRLSILKYSGNTWTHACLPGFSPGKVTDLVMAVAADGGPVVAFRDATRSDRVTVMRVLVP